MPSVPLFAKSTAAAASADEAVSPDTAPPDGGSQAADDTAVLFRVNVPGLSYEGYLHMQGVLSLRHVSKSRLDSGLIALAMLALAVGTMIAFAFTFDITSGLYIDVKRTEWSTHLGGGPLLLIIGAVAAAAYVAGSSRMVGASLRYTRSLYDEMPGLIGPQELVLTDDGFFTYGSAGHNFVRWNAVSDLVLSEGVWFIVIQGGSAMWLPEAVVRATADPDALRNFLRGKTGK